jgi:hypothetical protein
LRWPITGSTAARRRISRLICGVRRRFHKLILQKER